MKILTRYVVKEVLGPFFFGIFTFTSMILGVSFVNLLSQLEGYHVSIWTYLELLVLMIPQNIMWGGTIAVLLATLLGLGKLTGNSETIAMRAGGMSFRKVATPVLLIGLSVSILGVLLNEYVVPLSFRIADDMQAKLMSQELRSTIYNFSLNLYENDGNLKKYIYAYKYDPQLQQLQKVIIVEADHGQLLRTIEAEKMDWNGGSWFFQRGRINELGKGSLYPITVDRAKVRYPLNLTPSDIEQRQLPPEERSISELSRYIKNVVNQGPEKAKLLIYLHTKFSIPFVSLVFALLGVPLALRPQRRSSAAGYGLCFLFILAWWLLYMVGTSLGRAGTINPILGAWLGDIVLAAYGVYVFTTVKI